MTASSSSFSSQLRALVDALVELVVVLVAAEREPAREHAEEAVAAERLRDAVDDQQRWRCAWKPSNVGDEQSRVAQPLDAPGRQRARSRRPIATPTAIA
jgi:hypothetical protein